MAWHPRFFVCRSCECYADCSLPDSDVGVCNTCARPMVWTPPIVSHTATATVWCECHPWKKGGIAKQMEDLFSYATTAVCPRCGSEMQLRDKPGKTELAGTPSNRPLRPNWIARIVLAGIAAALGYLAYYGR